MIFIITNDGWWGETQGHRQHLLYGAIRCIETRREMVRSANTGISAKINKFGNITHQTKYNETEILSSSGKVLRPDRIIIENGVLLILLDN